MIRIIMNKLCLCRTLLPFANLYMANPHAQIEEEGCVRFTTTNIKLSQIYDMEKTICCHEYNPLLKRSNHGSNQNCKDIKYV